MPSFSPAVEKSIHAALNAAAADGRRITELAYLLLAILDAEDANGLALVAAEGLSVADLQTQLTKMIRADAAATPTGAQPPPSKALQQVIQRAALAAQNQGREAVTGADILQAILMHAADLPADVTKALYKAGITHPRIRAAHKGEDMPSVGPLPEPKPKPEPKATGAAPAKAAPKRGPIPIDNAQNPLSIKATNLNGHIDYVDPPIGVSFPTPAVPDPVTQLSWIRRGTNNQSLKNAMWSRGGNTCHFCGLKAGKYMEIVGPSSAARMDKMRVACIFCAQVSSLDVVSTQKSGVLMHLPEFGQAELNAYARIIYVCRISQAAPADAARRILERLMTRREAARERFGTDDPYNLAAMFAGCKNQDEQSALLERLAGIRVFPLDRRIIKEGDLEFNQFPQILAYWRSKDGPFGGLAPPKMDLRQFEAKVAGMSA